MRVLPNRALLASLVYLSLSGSPAPSTAGGVQYFADAYGSSANVADTILAGKSALVTLGTCGTLRPPLTKANTVAAVNALPAAATGVIDSTVSATEDARVRSAKARSDISAVNLLSRLITARQVVAASTTSRDDAGFRTAATGSAFAGLVVAGVPIVVSPGPNTRINLLGFGQVVLNEQIRQITPTSASLTVNMIHVTVTVPNALVPVGTNIVVGHATSQLLDTNIAGTLDGFAYGTLARVGRTFLSGHTAPIPLGCLGTNGAVRSEMVAAVTAQPELTTALVLDTVSGLVTTTSATGETTSTVNAANLLSSLVTADEVHAEAHAFTDGRVFTFDGDGSSFVNLSVSGFPLLDDHVGANTRVTIAGLGTLWLRREIRGPNSIEIRMLELVVDQVNTFGVPVGADIQVAVAHASAH